MPKKILHIFLLMALCVSPVFVSAAMNFTGDKCVKPAAMEMSLQTDWPASPLSSYKLAADTNLPNLVKYFFEWGVGLGGLGVFIALIIAGVQYITSIADPGKLKDARDRIKSSLIGLVLLLSSWAIFNLINPSLNTLQNIPDVTGKILDGGYASDQTCGFNWDCCKIPNCNEDTDCAGLEGGKDNPNCCVDSNCAPENFACCQTNDANCIKGKAPATHIGAAPIRQPDGSECIGDRECENNLCACDRTEDPWKLKCKENPKLCIAIAGSPTMGCDYVSLFPLPDFGGTPNNASTTDTNTGWINAGFTIGSYEAFRFARDIKGRYVDETGAITADPANSKKVPCGPNACGCLISVCDDVNPATTDCANPTAYATAYNGGLDGDHRVVNIKDETKGVSGIINGVKSGIWNTINGSLNWLKDRI